MTGKKFQLFSGVRAWRNRASQAPARSFSAPVSGSQSLSGARARAKPRAADSTVRWSMSSGAPQYSGCPGSVPAARPRDHRSQCAKAPPPAASGARPHSGRAYPSRSAAVSSWCAMLTPSRIRAPPGLAYGGSASANPVAYEASSSRADALCVPLTMGNRPPGRRRRDRCCDNFRNRVRRRQRRCPRRAGRIRHRRRSPPRPGPGAVRSGSWRTGRGPAVPPPGRRPAPRPPTRT